MLIYLSWENTALNINFVQLFNHVFLNTKMSHLYKNRSYILNSRRVSNTGYLELNWSWSRVKINYLIIFKYLWFKNDTNLIKKNEILYSDLKNYSWEENMYKLLNKKLSVLRKLNIESKYSLSVSTSLDCDNSVS